MSPAAAATIPDSLSVHPVPPGAPERHELAALLARAFVGDAHIDWLLPRGGDQARDQDSARLALFSLLVEDMGGGLHATADRLAAALWFAPGEAPDWTTQARFFQFLVTSLGMIRALGRGLDLKRMDARHPPRPHFYLQLLAVDPAHQRRGHGRALVERLLAQAREAGCPVYLETSREGNVDFYGRLGFSVSAKTVLNGGPRLWSMIWEPASRL